jgi:hypothetical protein
MSSIQRKTIALTVLFSLLTLIGGLCYGNVASASPQAEVMPGMDMGHCAGEVSMLRQGMPINGAMMPCCIDRHDNVPTVTPHVENQKVKFFPTAVAVDFENSIKQIQQKTYASSPSPPLELDILCSVIKIE